MGAGMVGPVVIPPSIEIVATMPVVIVLLILSGPLRPVRGRVLGILQNIAPA